MNKPLTKKQQDTLDFILDCNSSMGYPPTVREIAQKMKLADKSAYDRILALEKKGYIQKDKLKKRTIKVLDANIHHDTNSIPVLGKIFAGNPNYASENVESYVKIGHAFARSGKLFALKVKGESMKGDGIMDGDIAIINSQKVLSNGEIGVVVIEDEATIKRFYNSRGKVRLEPSNPDYRPIITDNAEVLGKLVGIFRTYK